MQSKSTKILIVIGAVVIGVGILGVAIFGMANLKHAGNNREFGMQSALGGRGGMGGQLEGKNFGGQRMGFGRLSGQVIAIDGSNLTIKDSAGDSITVTISDTTSIYNQGKIAKASDISVNNSVVVVGSPNSSGIVPATAIEIR
jgi:hypothetical protein